MNNHTLTDYRTTACGRLQVFSLYLDFPASIRARWANSTISQLASQNWITSTELWRLDALASSPCILNMSTGEAAKADVLLVVVSSMNYRQHELIAWLKTLALRATDRHHTGLLIGLFGDDEKQSSELNWTVKECLDCAGPMNRDFIWHKLEAGAMVDYSWLKNHLELFLGRKHLAEEQALLSEVPLELAPSSGLPLLAV